MIDHTTLDLTKVPRISIRVALYDPNEAQKNGWTELAKRGFKAEERFQRLMETDLVKQKIINLEFKKYKYAPTIQGTWVKEEALFMGAFYWATKDDLSRYPYPELISTPKPFMQIDTKHELYRFWTNMFENWFNKFWEGESN